DRFGEKPLYYTDVDGVLLFGSELKALRRYPQFDPRIDRDALALYVRFGYVPTPQCIYQGVTKIPAGSLVEFTKKGNHPQTSRYWSVSEAAVFAMRNQFGGSATEAVVQLDALLEDAVVLRLEADVPLGAFLSGGTDSSAVVMMMQRRSSQPVKTFT